MLRFFLRLPVIVLLAHAYVALRLAPALHGGVARAGFLAALLVIYLLVLGGFLTRRSEGGRTLHWFSWAGFLSLGLFSWLFVLTMLREVALLAAWSIQTLNDKLIGDYSLSDFRTDSVFLVLLISGLAVVLGLVNARRRPPVVDVDVSIAGLPDALHGYTLVQVSDLHVGPTIKKAYVSAVVEAVNALAADAVVLTGDLVDGSVDSLRQDTQPLAGLKARQGVYAVTGNHEYYSGATQWVTEFRRLGLQVLMNEHRVLQQEGATLVLAGVTDFDAGRYDALSSSNPVAALHGAPVNASVRILLAHQPRSAAEAAAAGFDLQLSGHTHGGQFWPWSYFVLLQQPFVAGLHRLGEMQVYVSRGTGYWGPPMRIGAASEITRIRLCQAAS